MQTQPLFEKPSGLEPYFVFMHRSTLQGIRELENERLCKSILQVLLLKHWQLNEIVRPLVLKWPARQMMHHAN